MKIHLGTRTQSYKYHVIKAKHNQLERKEEYHLEFQIKNHQPCVFSVNFSHKKREQKHEKGARKKMVRSENALGLPYQCYARNIQILFCYYACVSIY